MASNWYDDLFKSRDNNWARGAEKSAQGLLKRPDSTFKGYSVLSKNDAQNLSDDMYGRRGTFSMNPYDIKESLGESSYGGTYDNPYVDKMDTRMEEAQTSPYVDPQSNYPIYETGKYRIDGNNKVAPSTNDNVLLNNLKKYYSGQFNDLVDAVKNSSTTSDYFENKQNEDEDERERLYDLQNNDTSSNTGSDEPGKVGNLQEKLKFEESSNNYSSINDEGFMGAYQFGDKRLNDYRAAKNATFTNSEFINNKELQDKVYEWHVADITKFINMSGFKKYIGQKIMGVPVTKDGMIAVAHLGGKTGLKKFLTTNGEYNRQDSNGKSLLDYLRKFQ